MNALAQILLPLESRRPDRLEDFVPGPNQHVVPALKELLQQQGGCLLIRGAEGTGKSHLLNAACNLMQDRGLQAFYVALGRLPDEAAAGLVGMEEMDLICIDDIDQVAGSVQWEHALFHLFNRVHESRGRLVVSSRQALSALPFQLPDLVSRLSWGVRLQLDPLDDSGKLEVLGRKAAALGIEMPADVARFLISRKARNMASLLDSFEAVRVAALSGKRKITLPLVREVLGDS